MDGSREIQTLLEVVSYAGVRRGQESTAQISATDGLLGNFLKARAYDLTPRMRHAHAKSSSLHITLHNCWTT